MSFWNTSTGENATQNAKGSYDAGGGSGFITIPDGSVVLGILDTIEWTKDNNNNEFIEGVWNVVKPDEVQGVKIKHKLWVTDADPSAKDAAKKRDKALAMLANIDLNAGGRLSTLNSKPTDDHLVKALVGKPMALTVRVWEQNNRETGDLMQGNWIGAVDPKGKQLVIKGEIKKRESTAPVKPKDDDGWGGSNDDGWGSSSGKSNTWDNDLDTEVPF